MTNFTNIPQAQTLMLKPLNNLKKLKEKPNEYESIKYHKDYVAMGKEFLVNFKDKSKKIDQILESSKQEQLKKIKEY